MRAQHLVALVSSALPLTSCGPTPTPAPKPVSVAHVMAVVDPVGQAKLARVPDRDGVTLTVSGNGIERARTIRKAEDVGLAKDLLRRLHRRQGQPVPPIGPESVAFTFTWKGGSETLVYGLDPASPYAFRLGDILAACGVRKRESAAGHK